MMNSFLRKEDYRSPQIAKKLSQRGMEYLKIGTCITSAWAGVAAVKLLLNYNTPENLLESFSSVATTAIALSLPYTREITKLPTKFYIHARGIVKGVEKKPPQDLEHFSGEVSQKMGFKKPLKVHFFKAGSSGENAMCLVNDIYFSNDLYIRLLPSERKFAIAHECAHAKTKDATIKYLTGLPTLFQIFSIPAATLAALSKHHTDAKSALLAGGGAFIGSYLTYRFTKAAEKYVSRICEYRADRKAIQATNDPVSAITALNKIDPPQKKDNFWKYLNRSHPSSKERIKAILEETNKDGIKLKLNEDPYIMQIVHRTFGPNALHLNASELDGNQYISLGDALIKFHGPPPAPTQLYQPANDF